MEEEEGNKQAPRQHRERLWCESNRDSRAKLLGPRFSSPTGFLQAPSQENTISFKTTHYRLHGEYFEYTTMTVFVWLLVNITAVNLWLRTGDVS